MIDIRALMHALDREDIVAVTHPDGSEVFRFGTGQEMTLDDLTKKQRAAYDGFEWRPVPSRVSRTGLAIALAQAEIISESDAEKWAGGQALPEMARAAIDASGMSKTEKMAARISAIGGAVIPRHSDLVAMMQAAAQLSDDQVDDLFRAATG